MTGSLTLSTQYYCDGTFGEGNNCSLPDIGQAVFSLNLNRLTADDGSAVRFDTASPGDLRPRMTLEVNGSEWAKQHGSIVDENGNLGR